MNTFKILFISTLLCVNYSCTDTSDTQLNVVEEKFSQNTPLGQASVVDEVSEPNILHVAVGSPDHTTLVAAVQAANIEHVLVNAGPLTVFAPINSAFDLLPAGTVESLLKPENINSLSMILTRHAAPGSYNLDQLKKEVRKGRKIYMATGDYLDVEVKEGDVYIAGAKVLASIQTSNGIVNVIDKVILIE